MRKTITQNTYDGFLPVPPSVGNFRYVDVSKYIPGKETDAPQPKILILKKDGSKTGFVGLPQTDPAKNWESLMTDDTRTRELTPDEFVEWSRRCFWKNSSPHGLYRACPHSYTLSDYEDTQQRYEYECAAKTIHAQGRGMIFCNSKNVWRYHFPGDGLYYWLMSNSWKESNLMNRVEITTVIFLRKKEDPDWFNGRDDLCLRTFSYGTFLERFGFDRLARYHNGTFKPIEIRRFGSDEVNVYDYDEVTA